jgi:hypothetical protein
MNFVLDLGPIANETQYYIQIFQNLETFEIQNTFCPKHFILIHVTHNLYFQKEKWKEHFGI